MLRAAAAALGFTFALSVLCGDAHAQGMGGPQMPLGMDLAKVPLGSWGQYTMELGSIPPMKMRMGVVARTADAVTLETVAEGGVVPAGVKAVSQMILKDGKPSKMIQQMGDGDPMELPATLPGTKAFLKPDPKTLVGSETIKTPAGSFKTKHYRDKTAEGDVYDYWINDAVPPFGLVKYEGKVKAPGVTGALRLNLVAVGKDAKTLITKPVKPFDPAMLRGPGAGAPPPAKK